MTSSPLLGRDPPAVDRQADRRSGRRRSSAVSPVFGLSVGGHELAATPCDSGRPMTGMTVAACTILASNSSRNSVSAECDRRVRRRADEADRRHLVRERHGLEAELLAGRMGEVAGADRLADLEQLVEVLRCVPWPSTMRLRMPLQPRAALAARRALAARLVGVEADERAARRRGCRWSRPSPSTAPEPSIEPAAPTSLPSNGRSSCSGRNHGADPPPGTNALSSWPSRMPWQNSSP